jgi:hypothetical protein
VLDAGDIWPGYFGKWVVYAIYTQTVVVIVLMLNKLHHAYGLAPCAA